MSDLLQVENLVQKFDLNTDFWDKLKFKDGRVTLEKRQVNAVNGINFSIKKGEVFGLVGESGCGKSTTAKTVIKIYEPWAGKIIFKGQDISDFNYKEMLPVRKDIQMIFQDPYASLNPRQRLEDIIMEPMLFHKLAGDRDEAYEKMLEIIKRVGLRPEHAGRFPHQFSGGQRQRIGIARSLAVEPEFIIADEPVSALDVSIQAQILNILMDLKDEYGFSYLFIAHDLSVVKHISDRLGVMYLGYIVEKGDKNKIFNNPLHPYTRALFSAVPTIDEDSITDPVQLEGQVPNPINLPQGCCFHSRCPYSEDICQKERPKTVKVEEDHEVACHIIK